MKTEVVKWGKPQKVEWVVLKASLEKDSNIGTHGHTHSHTGILDMQMVTHMGTHRYTHGNTRTQTHTHTQAYWTHTWARKDNLFTPPLRDSPPTWKHHFEHFTPSAITGK